MVDAVSEFLTRKIDYGEIFSDILDCSLGIARRANESLYNMITLREQLNRTPKRTGRLGYKANPDYKNIESKIDRHFRNLRICAREEVREFNRINNEDIAIESFNATQHHFDCSLWSDDEDFSSGIHLLPSKPPITKTRVELDKTVNLEPSGYFNSLLNIEGLMPSNLDVSISPQEGKTVITTGDLKEKKIEELLKYADLKIVLKEMPQILALNQMLSLIRGV
jgi:hypothetical protein